MMSIIACCSRIRHPQAWFPAVPRCPTVLPPSVIGPFAQQLPVDLPLWAGKVIGMLHTIFRSFRLVFLSLGGHQQVVLENLALRQQLAILKRRATRPRLRETDRQFWVWLARFWRGWRAVLVIVQPETVIRWQRRRFNDYWFRLSEGAVPAWRHCGDSEGG
jgi:hypothetical protein